LTDFIQIFADVHHKGQWQFE